MVRTRHADGCFLGDDRVPGRLILDGARARQLGASATASSIA
jgi:hypothetical protein